MGGKFSKAKEENSEEQIIETSSTRKAAQQTTVHPTGQEVAIVRSGVSVDEDKDFEVVQQFLQRSGSSSLTLDDVYRLWDVVPKVLSRHGQNPAVVESTCTAFSCAMRLIRSKLPASSYQQAASIVESSLATLSTFKWSEHPQVVVSAMEFTNSLYTCFPLQFQVKSAVTQLATFYCLVLNPDCFCGEVNRSLSAASVFPTSLSSELFQELDHLQVHKKLRSLLVYYASMKNLSLLLPLLKFVEAEPASLQLYLEESLHIMLLSAAHMSIKSKEEQYLLWKLMTLMTTKSHYFGNELGPQVLVPALVPIVTEQVRIGASTEPIIRFLERYNSCVAPIMAEVEATPEFFSTLLPVLTTPRKLATKSSQQEVEMLAFFMASLCRCTQDTSAAKSLVVVDILPALEEAALQWPTVCGTYLLEALNRLLHQFPPSPSTLPPPKTTQLMKNLPQGPSREEFFRVNHLRVLQKLLSNRQTSLQKHLRESLYKTINALLRLTPSSLMKTWLDKEFLEEFVAAIIEDSTNETCRLSILVLSSHFIVFQVQSKEAMQVLCDLNFHVHTIDTFLMKSTSKEARVHSLNCIDCLFRSYEEFLKDISPFTKTHLPMILIDLAKEFGLGPSSDIGDGFGQLVLGLTDDKKASEELFASGYLKQLYSLVNISIYDPVIVWAAIHGVGNIALKAFHIKEKVIEDDFHKVLIHLLDCEMSSNNIPTACIRVLTILCSEDDWAKRKFTEMGLTNILVKLLTCRKEISEICWRALNLLYSLWTLSISNRELIITEPVLRVVQNVLLTNQNHKVIRCAALVFLTSADLDRSTIVLRTLGIVDAFERVMQNEAMISTNSSLKLIGSSLLEKNQLFTIPLASSSKPVGDVTKSITWPILPEGLSHLKEETDSAPAANDSAPPRLLPIDDCYMITRNPEAPQLSHEARVQLQALGLNPDIPLFRIGRVLGTMDGLCVNCDKDGKYEELAFRPVSLTPQQYQCLVDGGWFRRDVEMFRVRHNHTLICGCWETRVLLNEFDHRSHKSYKKVLKRMPEHRLKIETVPTQFNRESFDLYNSYQVARHDESRKSEYSYCEDIVNSAIKNQPGDGIEYGTFHQLYRLDNKLVAVGVIDVVPDGVISVYMWYDMRKEVSRLSFGVYSTLKEIEYARELSKHNPAIKYYYLQGWNGNNHKLSYKGKYEPEEFYSPCFVTGWVLGLESVKKAQEEFRARHRMEKQEEVKPEPTAGAAKGLPNAHSQSNNADSADTGDIPCSALPLDRQRHKIHTGSDAVSLDKLVVCLNHEEYMYFGDMMEKYTIGQTQRQIMCERYEELVLALGPELISNMVIDLKACPVLQND